MAAKVTNEATETLESLEPEVTEKLIVLGEGVDELNFVQKPLSFFGKIEFFSVVGKSVEKVLADGGSLTDILDAPSYDSSQPLSNSMSDADVFVKALSKIIANAPEILSDLYCVILAVPRGQREYVKMRLESELTDQQGMEILETFVDQNWEVMANFFKERILPLYQKISQKVQGSGQ